MGNFSDWLRNGKNYREGENPEFYEDTHDDQGEYRRSAPTFTPPQYSTVSPDKNNTLYSESVAPKGMQMPNVNQYISPRLYQNVVVYEPRTPEDVQTLIDFLKRREPAIINLDGVSNDPVAQRILDFTSGAIYALNGSVHRISSNIFLLSPEGVEITVPYDPQ